MPATAAHHNAVASGALLPQAPIQRGPSSATRDNPETTEVLFRENPDICEGTYVSTPFRSCAWSIDGATRPDGRRGFPQRHDEIAADAVEAGNWGGSIDL